MAQGVVDQVGERAFHQLQVTVQLQPAGRRAVQHHWRLAWHRVELLHGVVDQFVQAEPLAVQHLVGGLQGGQLEQLL